MGSLCRNQAEEHMPSQPLPRCSMRLLFFSIHCYLDPASVRLLGRVDLGGCPPKCRVAREHCCSPAPSERHVNLSVYAAQASPKAPRGTRWGDGHHLHDTGLGLTGVTRRRPHQQQAAVICSVSQASCSDGLVRRHPREVSPLSRGMISSGSSTPIRSITGRHSLPPSSSTRRPIGNPLAEGLPREEDDGLTTFHG